ncbi:hypothetical protein DMB37_03495 [Nocardia sp. CS682]|nr:hypothetical protein DMB37_03495 [Nocardia sp. CS682]
MIAGFMTLSVAVPARIPVESGWCRVPQRASSGSRLAAATVVSDVPVGVGANRDRRPPNNP